MGSGNYRRRNQEPESSYKKSVVKLILQAAFLLGLSPILYTLSTTHLQHAAGQTTSRWTLETEAISPAYQRDHHSKNLDDNNIHPSLSRSPKIPLRELVQTHIESSCPPGLILVNDTILPKRDTAASSPLQPRKIPRAIHMTGKTRCMPEEFVKVIEQWQHFSDHEFYFHNDAAMQRLLQRSWPEFPHLHQVLRCTKGGAGLADVWRALLMWEYGGIYTDIDNAPAKFDAATSISTDDDAFFVVERSEHLSQYFFAARPRHPLFFLLVQHIISRLLALNDVSLQVVSLVTGPGATRMAFCNFMNGQGANFPIHKPSSKCWYPRAKLYRGMYNFTVRAVGTADNSDEYVARDVIPDKNLIYKRMNMTYFRDIPKVESKESCIQRIYEGAGRLDAWMYEDEAAAARAGE